MNEAQVFRLPLFSFLFFVAFVVTFPFATGQTEIGQSGLVKVSDGNFRFRVKPNQG
ncbi:MAG TPA: hypothetical protein VH619_13735 [Verrucomicrobiae bacterium]|nr:hypothetical protein [Verrucomicrobiae bacterium]